MDIQKFKNNFIFEMDKILDLKFVHFVKEL